MLSGNSQINPPSIMSVLVTASSVVSDPAVIPPKPAGVTIFAMSVFDKSRMTPLVTPVISEPCSKGP